MTLLQHAGNKTLLLSIATLSSLELADSLISSRLHNLDIPAAKSMMHFQPLVFFFKAGKQQG